MPQHTVFIVGITGCQGGAVARQALAKGWAVRGLARSPASPAAQALAARGAHLVEGDFDDAAALAQAVAGSTAAFVVSTPSIADPTAELRWAHAILAAAKAAGVTTVVASTGLGTDVYGQPGQGTDLLSLLMQSKLRLEDAVRGAGFDSWTVLRPGFFMANLLTPKAAMYAGYREAGIWETGLLPTTRLPLVDEDDIGAFAVAAIERPAVFGGQVAEIGSDVRTPPEIIQVLANATGRPLQAAYFPDEAFRTQAKTDIRLRSYLVMREMIRLIDIDKAKAYGVRMSTFEEYVQRRIADAKATFL